jgi:GNAT superfamily N-acetyltransferase
MTVRRADVGDEALVRALRIAALTDVPHAFGSTLEREKARTPDDWRRWFSPGVTYVHVDENGVGAGLVAGILDEERSLAHLAAMWVHPAKRGQGVGDALVAAVVGWAEDQNRRVRLHVVEDNAPAVALYERHGFRRTGNVSVRVDGVREVEMERNAS